ncbi:hypothetical protein [Nocardia vaccinii]|uniref:hypothetical protein n=1 Tax=Nocardia vaccinii TaxID=1822 RepID=UPI000832C597|nr:hypothetical protein [Nocardia vaccinii]
MTNPLLSPYATVEQLGARWRNMPTDAASEATATTLLGDASFWLRQWFPSITGLIDAGQSDGTGAMLLVCAMVKRALINVDNEGVRQASDGMAGMSETRVYSNPDGSLYITANDMTLIQGGARAKSMTMSTWGCRS